jgi:uncharacterized protein YxjI
VSGPLPPPPPPPPPPFQQPASLSDALGLVGRRNFLVQHVIVSLGHSYRILDAEKRHLFTVQGDVAQNLTGSLVAAEVGGYLGRVFARGVDMTYAVVDAMGTRWATLRKQGSPNHATFTLLDNYQRPWVIINLARGLVGGIEAHALYPDGRPMMSTSGNLIRHNFAIRDPAGRDLAKVHEQWIAIADTYNVDLVADIDPLYPIVYSVAIDYEKLR